MVIAFFLLIHLSLYITGEQVLPSIQQETIPNADKFWMGLVEREKEAGILL